jgi:hypothetical protein
MAMTDTEKRRAVAGTLLSAAGTLVEFWTEKTESQEWAGEIDAEFARECLARWLNRLPGDIWDIRLNAPIPPRSSDE